MSKKRRREKMEARPTTWKIVTEHPDIFDTHIVTKLNGNDVKFFYDVNRESRSAVKRSGVRLRDAFKIGDFDTTSTISWALEKCIERRERFCAQMALNGNLELLQFLHEKGCHILPFPSRCLFSSKRFSKNFLRLLQMNAL